jgi:hypothetical protein
MLFFKPIAHSVVTLPEWQAARPRSLFFYFGGKLFFCTHYRLSLWFTVFGYSDTSIIDVLRSNFYHKDFLRNP